MTKASEQKYNSWHDQMGVAGAASDPLSYPWYETAFRDVKDRAHGDLLEVGCGRGDFAVWLAKRRPDLSITAVDFSPRAIEIADHYAAAAGASVRFRTDDAMNLSLAANSFDYVLSCECMEHVPDPASMAREISRVLRPGGRFCLTTENYFNGMSLAWLMSLISGKPYNSGSGVQPHENFFVFWRVARLLREAGLVVERTESNHYQWLLLPRVDPARLCTQEFSRTWVRTLAKPFGRHFSFFGRKPAH